MVIRSPRSVVVPCGQDAHQGRKLDSHGSLVALLACSGEGNQMAFTRLYHATSARVFGLALHILSDSADAEEATLDAYAAIWRHASSYDPSRGSPLAWILSITRSKAIDVLRARRRRPHTVAESVAAFADPGRTPEGRISVGERCDQMRRALGGLPREQRIAIELAYFEGMSHREVSEALGEPLGTVKSRIRLGMSSLRRELSETFP